MPRPAGSIYDCRVGRRTRVGRRRVGRGLALAVGLGATARSGDAVTVGVLVGVEVIVGVGVSVSGRGVALGEGSVVGDQTAVAVCVAASCTGAARSSPTGAETKGVSVLGLCSSFPSGVVSNPSDEAMRTTVPTTKTSETTKNKVPRLMTR